MSVKKILKSKKVTLQSFLVILGVGLGVLFAAQFKSLPARVNNPILPYKSLKDTREDLYNEQDELKSTIKNLHESIEKAQKETNNVSLPENALDDLKYKKAEAGLTKLSGQGVIIRLDDSKNNSTSEDAIVHAADLRDIVSLAWSSGAEAISINDQRVVLNTAIDCIVNTILINNQRISAPYQISVIGPKEKLQDMLKIGLPGLEKRKKTNGLIFNIFPSSSILIPAFDGSFNIKSEKSLDV